MEEKSKEFLTALARLQDSVSKIVKNEDNPYFKSKYTDLNALLTEIKPKIREHKFILIQTVVNNCLRTELVHIETGEKLESFMDLLTVKPDMQQLGSAITYARRYSILPMFNIECVDDDGNLASGKTKTFDELETVDDFSTAIDACKTPNAVSALWYKWSKKFDKASAEYKKLDKQSADMKLKLNNPDLKVEVRK